MQRIQAHRELKYIYIPSSTVIRAPAQRCDRLLHLTEICHTSNCARTGSRYKVLSPHKYRQTPTVYSISILLVVWLSAGHHFCGGFAELDSHFSTLTELIHVAMRFLCLNSFPCSCSSNAQDERRLQLCPELGEVQA